MLTFFNWSQETNECFTTWCALALTSINKFDIERTGYGKAALAMKHSQLTLSLVNSDVVFHLKFTIKISRGKNHLDYVFSHGSNDIIHSVNHIAPFDNCCSQNNEPP